jgi:hypothetical protein
MSSTDFYIGENRIDVLGMNSSGILVADESNSGVIYGNKLMFLGT